MKNPLIETRSYTLTASGVVGINGSGRIWFLLVANMFSIEIYANGAGILWKFHELIKYSVASLQTKLISRDPQSIKTGSDISYSHCSFISIIALFNR